MVKLDVWWMELALQWPPWISSNSVVAHLRISWMLVATHLRPRHTSTFVKCSLYCLIPIGIRKILCCRVPSSQLFRLFKDACSSLWGKAFGMERTCPWCSHMGSKYCLHLTSGWVTAFFKCILLRQMASIENQCDFCDWKWSSDSIVVTSKCALWHQYYHCAKNHLCSVFVKDEWNWVLVPQIEINILKMYRWWRHSRYWLVTQKLKQFW